MRYLDIDIPAATDQAIHRLNEYTNLTFLSPGSKARLVVEILSEEVGLAANAFDNNIGLALLRGAKGVLLDYLAEIYGLERIKEEKASVLAEEENFMFYTFEPTFGDINNGDDIVIPAESINVFNTNEDDGKIIYTNSDRIILPANENRVFFRADALLPGDISNVGDNTLVFHNFNNYSDVLNRTLLVTNSESVVYGQQEESDENLRYRIQNEKLNSEAGNNTAIRISALLVPGVADIVRIPFTRGIGTADWLIKSTAPVVSQELINSVQDAIDVVQSSGNSNLAKSPNIVGLETIFSLTYKSSLEDNEKETIKTEVRKQIFDNVNNSDIGEKLVLDQIVRTVLNSSSQIESMGSPNSVNNFSNIFVHKRSGLSDSIIRKSLISDYATKGYERVILEPNIETPIDIRDNN